MKNNSTILKSITCAILILALISTMSLKAQDYLINYAGSGASTTVDSVMIENLMQGTTLKMKGSEVLRLTVVTGIEAMNEDETGTICFYPNPMRDHAKMQFILPEPGETIISLYDISGRKISQTGNLLTGGRHVYVIQDVGEGIYFVKVSSGRYSCSGRLISSGSESADAKIVYENTLAIQEKQGDSKGTTDEKIMHYTSGDRLLLKGISGIYSTVITDVPAAGKTITFNFIPCTDGDGNEYPVVQIGETKGTADNFDKEGDKGGQIWMAENLKSVKYSDGTVIPNVTSNDVWGSLTTPAYCWYNNNIANKNVYGALYNWHAVNSGKLCPSGWHVPSDGEWTVLTNSLGGELAAGQKLKETGTSHWLSLNPSTNESGFTALPGGSRYRMVNCSDMNSYGNWWTSSEYSSTLAWYRQLYHYVVVIWIKNDYKVNGYSVRCLKD